MIVGVHDAHAFALHECRQPQDHGSGVDLRQPAAQRELLHRQPHLLEQRPGLLQAGDHRAESFGMPAQPGDQLSARATGGELVHQVQDADGLSHRTTSDFFAPHT